MATLPDLNDDEIIQLASDGGTDFPQTTLSLSHLIKGGYAANQSKVAKIIDLLSPC